MGNGAPGTFHVLRDALAQARQWLTLVLTSRNRLFHFLFSCWQRLGNRLLRLRGSRCRLSFSAFGIGSYVFKGDAAVSIGGRYLLKVNTQLEGEFAYGRRGQYTRLRCRCCRL